MELMFTITVMGLLLGLGVPSFMQTIRSNRLITQTNELVGALNFTRSEALKRANSVTICASANASTCSAALNWGTGFVSFVDLNSNGIRDGAEELLQAWPAIPAEFTLTSTSRTFVRYTASGTTGNATPSEVFNLTRPGCTGTNARRLTIPLVGRVTTQTVSC